MFFCHFHAAMPEQCRDLIDRNARQQQLDGKGVTKHVGATGLADAIRVAKVGEKEKLPEAALVRRDGVVRLAHTAPKEIGEIGAR